MPHTPAFRLCPSLLLAAVAIAAPLQADEGDIGYPSVSAARAALADRQDVRMSLADGWLTIEDPAQRTLWTFAPEADPAHPAAIKRSVIPQGDQLVIRMDIRCEGAIDACDALEQHFLGLNQSASEQALDRQPDPEAAAPDLPQGSEPEPESD
jgi:hypothetical protein